MNLSKIFKSIINYYPSGSIIFSIVNFFRKLDQLFRHEFIYKRKSAKRCVREIRKLGIRPVYLDIGSAGGLTRYWKHFSEANIVDVIGVDINENWKSNTNQINKALGIKNGVSDFYATRHPGCSSFLKPNYEIVKLFDIEKYFDIKEIKKIEVVRFDYLVENNLCQIPHFLKLDIQGYEYECLSGFGKYLNKVLALELEVQFVEIYEGQKLFHEIHDFLGEKGFEIRDIETVHWPILDKSKPNGKILYEMNVFYSRIPSTSQQETLIKFWEHCSGIWVHRSKESLEKQLNRIDSIPMVS